MIYILIIMWYGSGSGVSGKAALSVEFNSLQACQTAAIEVQKQQDSGYRLGTILCAAKGKEEKK